MKLPIQALPVDRCDAWSPSSTINTTITAAIHTAGITPSSLGTCYFQNGCAGFSIPDVTKHHCCTQMMPTQRQNGSSWRPNSGQSGFIGSGCQSCERQSEVSSRIGIPGNQSRTGQAKAGNSIASQ